MNSPLKPKEYLTKTAFPRCVMQCATYQACSGLNCENNCPGKFRAPKPGKPEPITQTELDISTSGFTLRV